MGVGRVRGGGGGGGGGSGFFFFKQKTAYEVYQCDWSSDVCSSDLDELAVKSEFWDEYESEVFYE